jgi:hydroxymethylglutaryl-CoA synthase
MSEQTVGISDMSVYVPDLRIGLDTILEKRAAEDPSFERRLRRAIESTNQLAIRFPAHWQDPVTLAAQASRALLTDSPDLSGVRYFAVGTETSVDMSKPISAYAQGALQRSGIALPRSLSTFQVQHACAGGTIAMMSVGAMLQAAGRPGESGLVVCSDVARYTAPSTAEITQGAGAVAMRIEANPQLVELDLATAGLASSDEDDFFRPLGSITARVKGRYSVDCYNDALDSAFVDHATRRGMTPRDVLESADIIVVHVPFHRMAVTGMTRLIEHHLEADPAAARTYLEERFFDDGIEATRHIGNIYSGSAYMSLMFALWNRYRSIGDAIVGKKILIASYGSGNTMTVLSARVAAGAPAVLARWDLQAVLDAARDASFETYLGFVEREAYTLDTGPVSNGSDVAAGRYYLSAIREDGYRQYEFAPA